MTTYKERKESKRVYILIKNCESIGAWGNLRALCDYMRDEGNEFPSYWTLVKKDKNKPMHYEDKEGNKYLIERKKLH